MIFVVQKCLVLPLSGNYVDFSDLFRVRQLCGLFFIFNSYVNSKKKIRKYEKQKQARY
jgi:hypothetical protein